MNVPENVAGVSGDAKIYDLVIVGSGFAGSLLAMVARRLGKSVLLLEKGTHPRFAIGESTSPLANLLLEQIATRYDLPRLLPLTTWGEWQRAYPEMGCGLKRGFTYYHHAAGKPYCPDSDGERSLMVSASPHDSVADTHWLRSDVDTFLVREAVAAGVDYRDKVTLTLPVFDAAAGLTHIIVRSAEEAFAASARFLVDATGPRGYMGKTRDLEDDTWADYPATEALFTHFSGVKRCDRLTDFVDPNLGTMPTSPYAPDDAAVHHLFDGGWMWVLRFGNGVASAGISVNRALAQDLRLADGAAAWGRFLERYPSIGAQFENARAIRPFVHAPQLAYRAAQTTGPGWVMLPSAAAFVDPLFSTGFPLTLLGVERLGALIEASWQAADWDDHLRQYERVTRAEADATAGFIAACHESMACFPIFASLSMLYFAAASYGEMARRLGRPALTGGFLASAHPVFGPALRRCVDRVRSRSASGFPWTKTEIAAFEAEVAEAVSVLNVAGLCDPAKRNRYGVDLNDTIQSASKLGLTPEAMRTVLRDAPWAQIPSR